MGQLDVVFDIVLAGVVMILMLSSGVLSEPRALVEYFKGEHLKLTIKLIILNILFIPAFSVLLLLTLPMNPSVALLIFLIAIAPAAPMVPTMVYVNRGDINWSLVLLFVLTIICLLTIPVMLHLGQLYLSDKFEINAVTGRTLLSGYVLPVFPPLAIGFCLKYFASGLATKITPAINALVKISNLMLILLVVLVNRSNFGELEFVSSLGLVGYVALCAFAGAMAVYPSAQKVQYVTAAITTGLRNFAIVLLLLNVLTDDPVIYLYTIPVSLLPLLVFGLRGHFQSAKKPTVNVPGQ